MNSEEFEKLTPGERFIVEWQYRMLGGFMSALAEAMARADIFNLNRLTHAFPDEGTAMWKFKNEEGWWTNLQKRMET